MSFFFLTERTVSAEQSEESKHEPDLSSYVFDEDEIDSYQEHDELQKIQEKKHTISEVLFFQPKEKNDSKNFEKSVSMHIFVHFCLFGLNLDF